MKIKCGVFFNIENIDFFCRNELYDLSKFKNLDYTIEHNMINPNEIKEYNFPEYRKFEDFVGLTYYQENSYTIFLNNCNDNWITNIEFTAAKYNLKAIYIHLNDEGQYPAYQLYYYDGSIKRVIQNIRENNRWSFFESGPQQSFEENDSYKEYGTAKKFDKTKMLKFCANLKIFLNSESFLSPIGQVYCSMCHKNN